MVRRGPCPTCPAVQRHRASLQEQTAWGARALGFAGSTMDRIDLSTGSHRPGSRESPGNVRKSCTSEPCSKRTALPRVAPRRCILPCSRTRTVTPRAPLPARSRWPCGSRPSVPAASAAARTSRRSPASPWRQARSRSPRIWRQRAGARRRSRKRKDQRQRCRSWPRWRQPSARTSPRCVSAWAAPMCPRAPMPPPRASTSSFAAPRPIDAWWPTSSPTWSSIAGIRARAGARA
jgi:hypothetical protein